MTPQRIPVTVIGGYLGAGKTTAINSLLRGGHGRRLAVLVNDFGAIDIDSHLVAAHDGDTISLANGCVCCTIADALGDALDKVLAMAPQPEQIVIEASGVANPAKIAMYGQGWPGLRLDGIVVIVDGDSVRTRADDKFVGATVRQQLAAADLLVLNKIDLLSLDDQGEVRDWLEQRAPDSRIIPARFGALPTALLLGQLANQNDRSVVAAEDHGAYSSLPFVSHRPFVRQRLEAAIDSWPAGVLRAKGLVYLRDDPAHAYVLQLVGKRYSVEKGPGWKGRPESQVVIIGATRDFDAAWLQSSLRSAYQ